MKKRVRIVTALIVSTFVLSTTAAFAQPYKNAVGLGVDLGDGATFVGPTLKHFFDEHGAIDVSVLFANKTTLVGTAYQYHLPLSNNVYWYFGGGPSLSFYKGNTTFFLRPQLGLDAKINNAPLALSFDWRPLWRLSDGSHFNGSRFQLGFKVPF